jgi:UDP-glucose 4-epimerase
MILVTGGSGFIGSHTVLSLLQQGQSVVVLDSLMNSSEESLRRVEKLSGTTNKLHFVQADICDLDKEEVQLLLQPFLPFNSCIHFAGLKAVGESVQKPLQYYEKNIGGTVTLLQYLENIDCTSLVFSSSATVYGSSTDLPLKESTLCGQGITNPYGRTKYMIEEILKDWKISCDLKKKQCGIVTLRYFNPIGNHESGDIGEDPKGIPNNLMPYVTQVAVGRLPQLQVFGNSYPTKDGTGVRDYIHVCDLAQAHVDALNYLKTTKKYSVFNIGTGTGYSVLEMIQAMEAASGQKIPYRVVEPRKGDVAECYADCSLARQELGWEAKRNLQDMCRDLWSWQSKNPNGYQ